MSVPLVAQVIASAVVSTAAGKIIGKVATKLTGSEKLGNALGIIGGVVAGGMAFNAMQAPAAAEAAKAGQIAEGAEALSGPATGITAGSEQAAMLAEQNLGMGAEGVRTGAICKPSVTPGNSCGANSPLIRSAHRPRLTTPRLICQYGGSSIRP